ncbi:putative sortase family protein [Actinoplanes missouriensis 431]|uniref:Putative sortase family protein n=1 Tax=Actinoplanes missouriensis (strain ATCC 14538 / DSM 43046 / CBS 188.64 / JCM 3121 / NBRC 102363 / NCIMB 12654 / NRRL B-3342 / UNCC 431) TaxID=512565 RepID=I0H6B1_ACTM4|nr:class F sortase [Actinoplanes missouriensis]BAL88548.1 putative sortase family protein [Actinoplanes missouriensis 431]
MSITPGDGTSRRWPGRALLLLVAGLVVAVTAGVVLWWSRPAADFGAPAVTALVSSSPVPGSAGSSDSPGSSGRVVAERVPIVDGGLPEAGDADAPVRLRIPALGLDADVDAVGLDESTGDFAVPPSVDRVGWYRYGPGFSADTGSIVVAGHVDSAAEGEGAFFRLGALKSGDRVTLVGPGGRDRTFEVVARERYRKTAIPLPKYFAREGEARLTLITCGGPFDEKTGHYRDNVVITAAAA